MKSKGRKVGANVLSNTKWMYHYCGGDDPSTLLLTGNQLETDSNWEAKTKPREYSVLATKEKSEQPGYNDWEPLACMSNEGYTKFGEVFSK